MKKPNALANALRDMGAKVPSPELIESAASAETQRPKTPQPSRVNTVPITCHYPEAVRRQLKILAAERGRNIDDLVAEGLNLVFALYGKAEIAPRKAVK